MKQPSAPLYLYYDAAEGCFRTSGIPFRDYMQYTPAPPEHLLILAGEVSGNRYAHCFEMLSGSEAIADSLRTDDYRFGDFCFVDLQDPDSAEDLTDSEIAALLFLGRMHRPLDSPFLPRLGNRMAYLSHDNGWMSKLYCRDATEPAAVLCRLLLAQVRQTLPDAAFRQLRDRVLALAGEGLLFDPAEIRRTGQPVFHRVGAYRDMDRIINALAQLEARFPAEQLVL